MIRGAFTIDRVGHVTFCGWQNRDLCRSSKSALVAPSTSIERVRSLQARGVINGFRAGVDLAAIGRPAQVLIAVRIRPPSRENVEGFRDWVSQLPETIGVFVTSGAQDFLVHVAVPDLDGLDPSSSTGSPPAQKLLTW